MCAVSGGQWAGEEVGMNRRGRVAHRLARIYTDWLLDRSASLLNSAAGFLIEERGSRGLKSDWHGGKSVGLCCELCDKQFSYPAVQLGGLKRKRLPTD